jgi:hypothetical protein
MSSKNKPHNDSLMDKKTEEEIGNLLLELKIHKNNEKRLKETLAYIIWESFFDCFNCFKIQFYYAVIL